MAVPTKQSLLKQHKSVGNFKSQTNTNASSYGLNAAPAKRQVFGDVSNTAHALVELAPKDKDYSKSRVHALSSRLDKTSNTTTDKDTRSSVGGALLRPAQRGLGPLPAHNISTAPKPPTHLDMPLVKPIAAKKATFIYSDGQSKHNIGRDQASGVESRFKNPRHFKSQPQLRSGPQMIPAVSRVSDKHTNSAGELINHDRAGLLRNVHHDARPAQERPINPAAAPMQRFELDVNDNLSRMDDGASDATYEDALENLASLSSSIETEIFKQEEEQESYGSRHVTTEYDHHQDDLVNFPVSSNDHAEAQAPSDHTEPEENWDAEEDEGDYYEEQGYTTGHSFPHGDNTTGQVTTIVAPKVTAKVRDELELARLHVEKTMTPDQIEEECWDTSMVAEYGDEIFEYMRNIEVSFPVSAYRLMHDAALFCGETLSLTNGS